MQNRFDKSIVTITGGAGLIGVFLAEKILERGGSVNLLDLPEQFARRDKTFGEMVTRYGPRVNVVKGTILSKADLNEALRGADVVFHLAAMLGVARTEKYKLACVTTNINGTQNVCEAAVAAGVKHCIFASSSEVYGEPIENPITEATPTQGKTIYGITKLAGEEIVRAMSEAHKGFEYTIARFFNTYGEGQVGQFVLSRFIKAAQTGHKLIINGDGSQKRSYCHAEDTAEFLIRLILNSSAFSQVFNIGNSENVITIKELASKTLDHFGLDDSLIECQSQFFDRSVEREINNRWCDNSKAKALLDYSPEISLDEGLVRLARADIHGYWAGLDE